ncbi:uncharacterized protein F5891DRAFT_981076 [Suillus fuscotomentosus]|uniref:Transposase n=1 Tax=Suillus fuscotomentosus TaxID=1912939 RepID=A0AAD4E5B4_9AGAM|nr:uncharacterized protein F5891DRAFT_981076 [Suillus fuscotomentosus]KAG1899551.1 hypothetical protein F5891DRAFT_981076 [Suillus fuscotomentosus]
MGPERTKFCDLCQQDLKPCGWTTHHKAYEKKAEKQHQNQIMVESIQRQNSGAAAGECEAWNEIDNDTGHIDFPDADVPEHVEPTFEVDNIMCEYHPSRVVSIFLFNVQLLMILKLFTKDVISAPYDGMIQEFDLHYQNLWEWAIDLLHDPWLFLHMVFDVQQCSKFNGKEFINFVDESYTAEAFWNIQSQLPDGAKLLAFILYADKTKLSSFGTARGYPVVARLANLPTKICNSQGIGGGYVVGWLPIEEKDHAGKPSWVNFKNAVWHEAFLKILSLTSQNILKVARDKETTEERENMLKQYGLCDVSNAFWTVMFMLHFNRGLYCDHLWAELQKIITGLGRASVAKIDNNYKAFPWWRNLKHLAQVMSISFSDSSVYEDISQMVIYAAHTIITEDECQHAVKVFSMYLQQYITKMADNSDKNWNFPKLHMSVHIFDDIEAKGATHNYNTKPNEKMHGSLKDSYLMHTNFRDVAPQLQDIEDALDEDNFVVDDLVVLNDSPHVKLGSRQAPQTFESAENTHKDDGAFTNFHIKLNDFLTNFLLVIQVPLSGGKWVQLKASNKMTDNIIFGHLLFVFECTVEDTVFSLTLIHSFDAPTVQSVLHLFKYTKHSSWIIANWPIQTSLGFKFMTNYPIRTSSGFKLGCGQLAYPNIIRIQVGSWPTGLSEHHWDSISWPTGLSEHYQHSSSDMSDQRSTFHEPTKSLSSWGILNYTRVLDSNSDDNFDEGDIDEVTIPGPNASKGEIMEALKVLQLQVQHLHEENCALKENNKVLLAEKPKQKQHVEAPDELVAHEQTISLVYFKDLVNKCISDACSNKIKKLCGVMGDIFDLPAKYFANPSHNRASIIKIQKMLGVSGKMQTYKIFLHLLFPGLQEDATLKTVFGNWILFAKILRALLHGVTLLHQEPCGGLKTNAQKWNFQQVTPGSITWAAVMAIFLLSPDTEFLGSRVGKLSTINYRDLFFQYKKLLVMKWDMRHIKNIVTSIDNHIFGTAKLSTFHLADSKADEAPLASSAISAVSSAAPDSQIIIQHEEQGSVSQAAACTNVEVVAGNVDDLEACDIGSDIGRGQGKAKRGKRPIAEGAHHGRSCKM